MTHSPSKKQRKISFDEGETEELDVIRNSFSTARLTVSLVLRLEAFHLRFPVSVKSLFSPGVAACFIGGRSADPEVFRRTRKKKPRVA